MSRLSLPKDRRGRGTIVVVTLLVALCGLAAAAPPAGAHAEVIASSPAAGAVLEQAPRVLVLTFSEAPDPSLSRVELLDQAGRPVAGVPPATPVPGHPEQLVTRPSTTLPAGVYTIAWRGVATDGHVETGEIAFRVGPGPTPSPLPASRLPASTTGGHNALVPPAAVPRWVDALQVAGRWLLYAGLLLLVGGAATVWLALRRLPARAHTLLRLGTLLAAVGLILLTYAEARVLGASSLEPLWASRPGERLLWLAGAVWVACPVALLAFELLPARGTLLPAGLAAAAAMVIRVLGGHADAGASPVAEVTLQSLHLLALGLWVGGLPWLLLGVRGLTAQERAADVRRFSAVATAGIALVALTGVLRSAAELGSLGELFNTAYGLTLLAKIQVFLVLAALGAITHFRLVPAMPGGEAAVRPFRRSVRGELLVAAAVLALAAALAGLAPPVA